MKYYKTRAPAMNTVPGVYKHHKGGRYRVLLVAKNATNGDEEGEEYVVYVSLTNGKVFVRREFEFHELVSDLTKRRFTLEKAER